MQSALDEQRVLEAQPGYKWSGRGRDDPETT